MTSTEVALRRLKSQGLAGTPFESIEAAVGALGAVQSQEVDEARWGLALRTRACSGEAVDQALDSGTILRTHVLRPTWHFVLASDLRWLLDLTAPRIRAGTASRWRELELDDRTFERCNGVLAKALEGGQQLTRGDLDAVLQAEGIATTGQRLPHILMRAELDQVMCSGARRGKHHTYASFDARVPKGGRKERDEAIAELAIRYFGSHGPATLQDFAWWSGLTLSELKACGLHEIPELRQMTLEGKTYWFTESSSVPELEAPLIHLLPNYDELVVAYKDHERSCAPGVLAMFSRPGEVLSHPLTLNGQVVGQWRRTIGKRQIAMTLAVHVPLQSADRDALSEAAERFARYLGLPLVLNDPLSAENAAP